MKLNSKRYKFIFSIIIIVIIGYSMTTSFVNKRWKRICYVKFQDGTNVIVDEYHSDSRYIVILPHLYGFTIGKDNKDTYSWKKNDEIFIRMTYHIPIIIDEFEGIPYIVEFDRETDFSKIAFRFYKYENEKWVETDYSQFPKPLAIQNKWLDIEDVKILSVMDPEDSWFRESLTGRLWIQLETGKNYYEIRDDYSYPLSFFKDFKEKYITRKDKLENEIPSKENEPQASAPIQSPDALRVRGSDALRVILQYL